MKSKLFLSVAIVILTTSLASPARAQELSAVQIGRDSVGHISKSKIFMSHGKVRIESVEAAAPGSHGSGETILLLDLDAGTSTVLDANRKTYMEQSPTMARQSVAGFRTADNTPCVRNPNSTATATCKRVGTEMINGREVEKWEIVQSMGGQTVTAYVWLDSQWHFRVKQEVAGMTGEMQNIKLGPQPASLFEIPADYHKITMQDRYSPH